jgi:hypothetical protein
VLLELARVLADSPRPYTIWLAFIEGDGTIEGRRAIEGRGAADGGSERAAAVAARTAADPHAGSRALAQYLAGRGDLDRIRLAIWLESPGRPDLLVARDLRSHRAYREVFWESAEFLGVGSVFADENGFGRADTGHVAFVESGMRRVVAIAPRETFDYAADAAEAHDDDEARARANMEIVGAVTLESLARIARRLERIDGFAQSPLRDLPGDVEPVQSKTTPPDGEGAPSGGSLDSRAPADPPRPDAGVPSPPADGTGALWPD